MELSLLKDITTILVLSIVVIFICHKIKLPVIVGFLFTGILAGPHGLGLIKVIRQVELLSEIGIVLLLFTIGIEFSFRNLFKIKRAVIFGGSIQVLFTVVIASFIAKFYGLSSGLSIFIGFLVSLSSTAIVLKTFQERGEIDSPHGIVSLGILIFQDIVVVPMMLLVPVLAGQVESLGKEVIYDVLKGLAIIVFVVLGARWIVPQVLYHIAKTKSRELFILSIIAICLTVAGITSWVGLSIALGAFLAGLIISESEYSYQALSNVLPIRDISTSFFFISIGMLLDLNYFLHHPSQVLLISVLVIALKTFIAGSTTALLGFPFRTNMLVGLALSQVGEFSFILFKTGTDYGLMQGDIYQLFLTVSVITMAVAPIVIELSSPTVDRIHKLPMPRWFKYGLYSTNEIEKEIGLKEHIIIVGYGLNGRNLAQATKECSIPYVILELNPEIVKTEKIKGESIYYGDATQESVLKYADIKDAKVIIIGIYDPIATRRIIEIARRLNKNIWIITHTRLVQEIEPLIDLGADEVITDEIESSIEIFTRVLERYRITEEKLVKLVDKVHIENFVMVENLKKKSGRI